MTHLAIVGTGYWGENHARVGAELLDAGTVSALTLCDANEERVSEIAGRYGVEYVTDYQELTARGVDAAVLATPSHTHHEIGMDLVNAGIDLLVEKPLALTTADATALVDCATENDVTIATGHIFRFHSAFRELAERVERGELGEIRYISTNRYAFRTPRRRAGTLHSLAVHDLDLYSCLFDRAPSSLYCDTTSFIRDDIDETATVVLSFGEAAGVINVSWQVPVFGKRRDITVVGSKRTAYIDYTQETTLELYDAETFRDDTDRYISRNNGSIRIETDQYEPLKRELTDFLEAAATGARPTASGQVGANAVYLVERALKSAARGETVACQDQPF